MSEGTLVLVNPPKQRKVKKMATKRTTTRKARKPVKRGGTKASRSASAKKAAATRKRNAAKRSRAAKKAAATRKRNASKRSAAGKKAAASRKRKASRKSPARKTSKRGPSKAKRSAAAKKGWRTRRAKTTKRSNAAKRAARSRKSTTRRTKRKAAPKRKSTRMTKAKRSAAAKKGWRTRRSGGAKRKSTTRRTKRKSSRRSTAMALTAKKNVGIDDFLGFVPGGLKFKGISDGFMAIPGKLKNDSLSSLTQLSYATFTGFTLMGVLGATKSEIMSRLMLPGMLVDGASTIHNDLGSAVDAAIDLATVGGLGIVLADGLKMDKAFVKTGVSVASLLIAADFVRSITLAGVGSRMDALSEDVRSALPSVNNITGLIQSPFGGLGMTSQTMFGMHANEGMGMAHGNMGMMHGAHGNNNLALAMSPNNTAATGNAKFFGTKSLGSTRVNLF